jgi:hypothetical protein
MPFFTQITRMSCACEDRDSGRARQCLRDGRGASTASWGRGRKHRVGLRRDGQSSDRSAHERVCRLCLARPRVTDRNCCTGDSRRRLGPACVSCCRQSLSARQPCAPWPTIHAAVRGNSNLVSLHPISKARQLSEDTISRRRVSSSRRYRCGCLRSCEWGIRRDRGGVSSPCCWNDFRPHCGLPRTSCKPGLPDQVRSNLAWYRSKVSGTVIGTPDTFSPFLTTFSDMVTHFGEILSQTGRGWHGS